MRRTEQGFSLIELLVVITILGALAAGGTVFIRLAEKSRAKTVTQQRLASLSAALEEAKKQLGYYPPTYTQELRGPGGKEKIGDKVGVPNETNVGIETLYVAFNMTGVNPDMQGLGDGALANTDEDQAAETIGGMQVADLFEYVDYWGNPLIYFASKDLKDVSKVCKYVTKGGVEVTAEVRMSTKTNLPLSAQTYQLFSMGPDQTPGTDDDIAWGE